MVVVEKVNDAWWWGEVDGETGYVPTNHLSDSCPAEGVDRWQDNEYFSSYNTLVMTNASVEHSTLIHKHLTLLNVYMQHLTLMNVYM